MKDVARNLHEGIQKQLNRSDLEVIGVIPLSLKDDDPIDTVEYLVQLKPKKQSSSMSPRSESYSPSFLEGIYLANGKLNIPYLVKNADMLFDATDYQAARKIYKTILQSGEYTSTALQRLGKCYEAEGKLEDACTKYEESIAYHPTVETYQRLASVLLRQNKEQQAEEVLEKAQSLRDAKSTL
jgi:tetratricopeptide (TPR) repeat protein